MPDEDQPLDLEDQPFAADLDVPRAAVTDPFDDDPAQAAHDLDGDDGWGDDAPDPALLAADDADEWDRPRRSPAPRPASGPVADEWVRPRGQSSSLLLLMGVVVLVMVGVVVFLAINNKDDAKSTDPTIPSTAPGAPAGGTPTPTAPDPGNDPDLEAAATVADAFDRAGPALGTFPKAGAWTNLVGTIEIEKGVARTVEVAEDSKLQLASVDAGSPDVTAEVRLPSPVDRAGIAVRVASADRFIGLFATSDYGTYTLARFENGELDPKNIIGNTDLTGVSVGDVIGIRAKGSKVEVLTNGTVRNSFDDPKLEIEGNGVGLFAFLDDTGPKPVDARDFANWDDFSFLAAK